MSGPCASWLLCELGVPANADRLKLVRTCVAEAAALGGARQDAIADLVHAADEACQNIIRHAYKGRTDGWIDLRMHRDRDLIRIELLDGAPPVSSEVLEAPQHFQPAQGGMGNVVIRACVEDVSLEPRADGQGNCLTLRKRIS